MSTVFMNNSDKTGLFTSQGCCSDKAAAHEVVVFYYEGAATKSMQ